MTSPNATYDARVRELSRMNKPTLADLIRRAHPSIWTAHPLDRWSKDELVRTVLEDEFPAGRQLHWTIPEPPEVAP